MLHRVENKKRESAGNRNYRGAGRWMVGFFLAVIAVFVFLLFLVYILPLLAGQDFQNEEGNEDFDISVALRMYAH